MLKKILFFIVLITVVLSAQSKDDQVIAKIGDKEITVEEFRKRYEFSPQVGREVKNSSEGLKRQLLYTLIAEKLWALEAEANNIDTSKVMEYSFNSLEKMYVRDALYRDEIMNKVQISNSDLREAMFRYSVIHNLNFIYSKEASDISNVYKQLEAGAKFDDLLAKRPEKQMQNEPYQVEYGKMDKAVEDAIFELQPGEYTKPVQSPEGWYIFKLVSVEQNKLTDINKANERMKRIKKVLRETKEDSIYGDFYGKFFKGRKITTNGHLFWSISEILIDIVQKRKVENKVPDGEKIHLDYTDYYTFENKLGPDTLAMNFVEFGNKPVSVHEFLREFIFEGFFALSADKDTVRAQLNARVKDFISKELLAREAFARKLENFPEVKTDIEMWRDYYMATAMKSTYKEKSRLTEEEARNIYNGDDKIGSVKVNIQEILTDSLEVIEKVFNELEKGTDWATLAKMHSKRKWAAKKGGEFGYFPVSEYGEIGTTAATMEVGEIFGPLDTPDGFSIFKLLGKKVDNKEFDKPFEEVKAGLMKQLNVDKYTETVTDKTVELANKYGVTINEKGLKDLQVTEFNMVVFKYFGFGGQMAAVPIVAPFTGWVKPWSENRKALP